MRLSLFYILAAALCIASVFNGCKGGAPQQDCIGFIPPSPDYADSSQWYVVNRGSDIDIFYIISTETDDYLASDGTTSHYADTYSDSVRRQMTWEMRGVDGLLSGELNYYAPYYRQCTMESFVSDSLAYARFALSMGDIKRAFEYYMKHLNGGRPFVLMGFSQGAMAVVELVKGMDDESYSRMVAAYVLGWRVTGEDMAGTTRFRPAHDSADIGVTVCYNSVRDDACAIPLISGGNCIAINPVNWRTDETPAMLIAPGSDDTLRVTLSPYSLLLHVEGYTGSGYEVPLIGSEGNYHCLEIALYSDCLRRNVSLRAAARRQNHL